MADEIPGGMPLSSSNRAVLDAVLALEGESGPRGLHGPPRRDSCRRWTTVRQRAPRSTRLKATLVRGGERIARGERGIALRRESRVHAFVRNSPPPSSRSISTRSSRGKIWRRRIPMSCTTRCKITASSSPRRSDSTRKSCRSFGTTSTSAARVARRGRACSPNSPCRVSCSTIRRS